MRYSSQSCEMSITHFYLRSSNASIYTAYVDVSPLWHLSIRFIMGKGCQRKYAHIEFLSWFESQHMCLVLSQPWQRSPSGLHIALSAWGFRRRQEASSRHCQKPHCTEHALWPGTTHPLARTPLHFSNLSKFFIRLRQIQHRRSCRKSAGIQSWRTSVWGESWSNLRFLRSQ